MWHLGHLDGGKLRQLHLEWLRLLEASHERLLLRLLDSVAAGLLVVAVVVGTASLGWLLRNWECSLRRLLTISLSLLSSRHSGVLCYMGKRGSLCKVAWSTEVEKSKGVKGIGSAASLE